MSFGLNDIAAGVSLGLRIYDRGFAEENRADVRYANFRNDIKNFRYLLQRLREALLAAQARYEESNPILESGAIAPLSEELDAERRQIIGNFEATLRDCETLLEKNKQLRHKHSNVLENLRFHLTKQEHHVDDLRRRLHFHSVKIRFVIDRLSVKLLTHLDAKVDDLLAVGYDNLHLTQTLLDEVLDLRSSLFGYLTGRGRNLSPVRADRHIAKPALQERFLKQLRINGPDGAESDIPIQEGFDALLLHFQQSVEGADQTPEKYLLFLKARWLHSRLTASREYVQARPGYYYKRAINQIGHAIFVKARQTEILIQYDETDLMALEDSCFRIWPLPVAKQPARNNEPSALIARAGERKALHMEFPLDAQSEPDSITVFESDQHLFRIVQKVTRESESGAKMPEIVTERVDCHKHKLIPMYALPTLSTPSLEMSIVLDNDEELLYSFDSLQSLHKFQTALMGYDIPCDCQRIRCQFSDNVEYLDCSGRVQIWQEPIAAARPSESSQTLRNPNRTRSSFSQSSQSRYDSLAPSLTSTNTVHVTDGGWQADNMKSSALVIYTKLTNRKGQDEFVTMFIELNAGIGIDRSRCRCIVDYDDCRNVVLCSSNGGGIPVRVLRPSSSSTRRGLNPTTFNIFPLRLPRHSDFYSAKLVRTEYLIINFLTLPDKKFFVAEIDNRALVRNAQKLDQRRVEEDLAWLNDHPQSVKETVENQPTTWMSAGQSSSVFHPGDLQKKTEVSDDDWSVLGSEDSTLQRKPDKAKGRWSLGRKEKKEKKKKSSKK